jgi:hypothetical protein
MLSDDRINAISHKVAFELMKKRYVTAKSGGLGQLTACVEKPILEYFEREDQVDLEVKRILASMSTCPPEGSFAYQALYQKKKEEIAHRFGQA